MPGGYHTGEAIAVPDLTHEARFTHFCPRALHAGLGAVFTFPLDHGELRLGALDPYRETPGPLSPDSMSAAQTLADAAAAYLLTPQARADLQDSTAVRRQQGPARDSAVFCRCARPRRTPRDGVRFSVWTAQCVLPWAYAEVSPGDRRQLCP